MPYEAIKEINNNVMPKQLIGKILKHSYYLISMRIKFINIKI
jgi:hypothetical protein